MTPATTTTVALPNQQHEIFCLNFVTLGNATQAAILARFSPGTARQRGYKLLQRGDIQRRVAELRAPAVKQAEEAVTAAFLSESIAGVIERKTRLSEILRARVSDFVKTDAQGRAWLSTNLDGCQSAAIASIKTRMEIIPGLTEDDEDKQAWITELRLHDPVKSIHELNDMEMVGKKDAPDPSLVNVNNNVNINVVSPEAGALTQKIIAGGVPGGPDVQYD